MKKAFHRKLLKISVEDQRAITSTVVPDERNSYTLGVGAEGLPAIIKSFRDRPGEIYLGADARVLGFNFAEVRAALDELTAKNIKVIDLSHMGDDTPLKLLERCRAAFQWNGDRRHQKRKGSKGGVEKGNQAKIRRSESFHDDIGFRLCGLKKLTWNEKEYVLGVPKATLIRHYT
jgi:hypothetical protein